MNLKKKLTLGVILTLPWPLSSNKFIGVYLRSQVSVYRTIGPLVIIVASVCCTFKYLPHYTCTSPTCILLTIQGYDFPMITSTTSKVAQKS